MKHSDESVCHQYALQSALLDTIHVAINAVIIGHKPWCVMDRRHGARHERLMALITERHNILVLVVLPLHEALHHAYAR